MPEDSLQSQPVREERLVFKAHSVHPRRGHLYKITNPFGYSIYYKVGSHNITPPGEIPAHSEQYANVGYTSGNPAFYLKIMESDRPEDVSIKLID